MTRKALPKAITHKFGNVHEISAGDGSRKQRAKVQQADDEIPAQKSNLARDPSGAEPAPVTSLQPEDGEAPASAPIRSDPQETRRRVEARKIVDRHKLYAAMGGLFPVPVVNVAGVSAIIVRMIKGLSELYQVPFERDRTRSIVVGIMGGAVPTGLAAATASTLSFAVPGSSLVGLAVSSISAAAFTRGIGLVFIEHFESGLAPLNVDKSASP